MKQFSLMCVDDFYDNPDEVLEFALKQNYIPSPGFYPGKRTEEISALNEDIFIEFCKKLIPLYYPIFLNTNCYMDTTFWKVPALDKDPLSPKNSGWIHVDGGLLAGVIYLTPGIDENLGTKIYKKKEDNLQEQEEYLKTSEEVNAIKSKFYTHGIDEGFDKHILKHNSFFHETVFIKNVYNRMICFSPTTFHSPTNFYSDTERLAQVFYIHELKTLSNETKYLQSTNLKFPMHSLR